MKMAKILLVAAPHPYSRSALPFSPPSSFDGRQKMQMPRQRKIFLSRSIWLLGRLHRQLVWLFWSCLWVCHMFWHLTDCLGCLLLLDIFFVWLTFDSELSLYFHLPVNSNFSWSWACLCRNSPCCSLPVAHGSLLPARSVLPKVLPAASSGFGSGSGHSLGRKLFHGEEFSCIQIRSQKLDRHCSQYMLYLCVWFGFYWIYIHIYDFINIYIYIHDYYTGEKVYLKSVAFTIFAECKKLLKITCLFPSFKVRCLTAFAPLLSQHGKSWAKLFFNSKELFPPQTSHRGSLEACPCDLPQPAEPAPGFSERQGSEAGRNRWAHSREQQPKPRHKFCWDFFRWLN